MPLSSNLSGGGAVRGGGGGGNISLLMTIIALDQASSGLNKIANSLGQVDNAARKAGEGGKAVDSTFKTMAGTMSAGLNILKTGLATLYAFNEAFQALLAVGEQGAAFLQTTQSFYQMGEAVNADIGLLENLRKESQGTVSDMQLMSLATTAMAGASGEFGKAVANNLPHILEIAKAANKANPALGSVDFQFQSLIIGLKRLSPRLIDNTGLQLKLGAAYETFAKQIGKTREELTAEEQQMALLNATMEAGNRLLSQVGGTAESLTDPFQRLKAEQQNLSNTMSANLSESTAKLATKMADLFQWLNAVMGASRNVETVFSTQNKSVALVAGSYEEYVQQIYDTAIAVEGLDALEKQGIENARRRALGLEITNESYGRGVTIVREMEESTRILTETQFEEIRMLDGRKEAVEKNSAAMEYMSDQSDWLARKEKALKLEVEALKESLEDLQFLIDGPVLKSYEDFIEKQGDLQDKISDYRADIEDIAGKDFFDPTQRDQIEKWRKSLEGVDAQMKMLKETLEEDDLKKKQRKRIKEELEDLEDAQESLIGRIEKAGGVPYITDEDMEKVGELLLNIEETEKAIKKEEDALRRNNKELAFNIAQKQILAAVEAEIFPDINNNKTAWDDASYVLNELAVKLGLIDEGTRLFNDEITRQTTALITENQETETWTTNIWRTTDALSDATIAGQEYADVLNAIPNSIYTSVVFETGTNIIDYKKIPGAPVGFEAEGGNVFANKPYIVGEKGWELFVPPSNGRIIPNNRANDYMEDYVGMSGGGGGGSVTYGGDTKIINHIYNPAAAALALAEQRRMAKRRINAGMGV